MRWVVPLLSIILVLFEMGFVFVVAHQRVTHSAISITAPLDRPESALPAFAQFNVSQRLKFPPINTASITLPMYFPDGGQWIKIDLVKDGYLLQRWRYKSKQVGRVEQAVLLINPPLLIEGDVDVKIDGSHIPYDKKDLAPRVFIQTADYFYKDGNYRIAENEKSGDIALSVEEQLTRWELFKQQLSNKPVQTWLWVSTRVLLGFFIAVLPWTVFRIFEKSKVNHQTGDQK